MKERNGFREKWIVLGGHRVKVRIPPEKPLEERKQGLAKLILEIQRLKKEAESKKIGKAHL